MSDSKCQKCKQYINLYHDCYCDDCHVAELDRLRAALDEAMRGVRFYGDEINWQSSIVGHPEKVFTDSRRENRCGKHARETEARVKTILEEGE